MRLRLDAAWATVQAASHPQGHDAAMHALRALEPNQSAGAAVRGAQGRAREGSDMTGNKKPSSVLKVLYSDGNGCWNCGKIHPGLKIKQDHEGEWHALCEKCYRKPVIY